MQRSSAFTVGQWLVEPKLNRISFGDEEKILVPKVMALLLVLVEHQGEPLNQEQLIELVWPGQVVSTSSVYQAVAKLRSALGDSSSEPEYIERISNKGYRLIATVGDIKLDSQKVDYRLPIIALLVCCVLFGWWLWSSEPQQEQQVLTEQSITVDQLTSITLVDLTQQLDQPNQELSALNHVLLSQLMHIEGLKVVHLKQQSESFNTDAHLSGKIVNYGDVLQVFLQIQHTTSAEVLWAKMFEVNRGQTYQLQNQIVQTLLGLFKRKQSVATLTTKLVDERSFDQYMLARHLWDTRTEEALHQAKDIYLAMQQQGKLFPLAAVGLCETYHFLHIYSNWSLDQALKQCDPLLERALATQPELGEALASRALLFSSQGQRDKAKALFEQALIKSPNYAFGLMWYGNLIRDLGQFDEALAITQQAYDLAPMSPVVNRSLAYSYLTLSRFTDARYYYQRALTLDPGHFVRPVQNLDFLPLNVERAKAFLQWRDDNPIEMARRPYYKVTGAQINLSLGLVEEAEDILNGIDKKDINPAFLHYMKASILSAKGDLEGAARHLKSRMAFHPDKRRFVMPYLSNLLYRKEVETAYQLLLQLYPTLAEGHMVITEDNQFIVALYLQVLAKKQSLSIKNPLQRRLNEWFAAKPPQSDYYYLSWLMFSKKPNAAEALKKLLIDGWLPDYNEDMLAEKHVRQLFIDAGLGQEWFDEQLKANRIKAIP